MNQRRVLLAVTGGIAAYKAPELVRALTRAGCVVRCAMTPAAREFVTPLVLQTLTGERVATELFDLTQECEIGHIALADWAELLIVAPATANTLAKLAHGLADDPVSTLALATRAPILVAPAMNVNMWRHAATQRNMEQLADDGVQVIAPGDGDLACGYSGPGRVAEPWSRAAYQDAIDESLDFRRVQALHPRRRFTRGGRHPLSPGLPFHSGWDSRRPRAR